MQTTLSTQDYVCSWALLYPPCPDYEKQIIIIIGNPTYLKGIFTSQSSLKSNLYYNFEISFLKFIVWKHLAGEI